MAFGRGKLILFGEHAVVYGRPALAAGIERGVLAQASASQQNALRVDPWGISVTPKGSDNPDHEALAKAFATVLAQLPQECEGPSEVHATVDIPTAAGLGASAALGVAVIGALHERFDLPLSNDEAAEKALAWEQVFHGNASGIDNQMAAHGGIARYRKGESLEPIALGQPLHLLVAHSGEGGCTRTMVESVADQCRKDPKKLEKVFDGVRAIVDQAQTALKAGELDALGQLMVLNQTLLSAMMVSTARIEELCRIAMGSGALGAKLTGAGGGGCIIALTRSEGSAAVHNALTGAGAETFPVTVSPGGVP